MPDSLETLQERMGVFFQNRALLEQALTHRSAGTEQSQGSNERLEFLGDAVVGLVVGEKLYRQHPHYHEGRLARARAYVVSEKRLAQAALAMGLPEYLEMSTGEDRAGGRTRPSILSDALEALVAALYLDSGLEAARGLVLTLLSSAMEEAVADTRLEDYKTALQEMLQAERRPLPSYRIVQETGQEHNKTFVVEVVLEGESLGRGEGRSKKEAEQSAARCTLELLENQEPSM